MENITHTLSHIFRTDTEFSYTFLFASKLKELFMNFGKCGDVQCNFVSRGHDLGSFINLIFTCVRFAGKICDWSHIFRPTLESVVL